MALEDRLESLERSILKLTKTLRDLIASEDSGYLPALIRARNKKKTEVGVVVDGVVACVGWPDWRTLEHGIRPLPRPLRAVWE